MNPSAIPFGTDHLDTEERQLLHAFLSHIEAGQHREAQDAAEDLWKNAVDAHKRLWQGISNALTAVCAKESGHPLGARQIASRSHEILAPYPRLVVGLDLDLLLTTMDRFVTSGTGNIQVRF